jgi:hypothetical protein
MHVIYIVSSGRPWLSYRAGKREQHAQQKDKLQGFQWLSMAFTADTNPRIPRFWCFISYTKVHHIMVVEDRKW